MGEDPLRRRQHICLSPMYSVEAYNNESFGPELMGKDMDKFPEMRWSSVRVGTWKTVRHDEDEYKQEYHSIGKLCYPTPLRVS